MKRLFDAKPGDVVVLRSVNERRGVPARDVRIVKVGPKNVYIENDRIPYGREDGRRKDEYRHEWLQTHAERDEEERVAKARASLDARGIALQPSFPRDRIAELAESVEALFASNRERD